MESELLDTLSRQLAIEWVTNHAAPPLVDRFAAKPGAPSQEGEPGGAADLALDPMPADAAWELHRLARKGHAQALQDALEDWCRQAPEHTLHWQHIKRQLDLFEMDAIVDYLNPFLVEDSLDEPQS